MPDAAAFPYLLQLSAQPKEEDGTVRPKALPLVFFPIPRAQPRHPRRPAARRLRTRRERSEVHPARALAQVERAEVARLIEPQEVLSIRELELGARVLVRCECDGGGRVGRVACGYLGREAKRGRVGRVARRGLDADC